MSQFFGKALIAVLSGSVGIAAIFAAGPACAALIYPVSAIGSSSFPGYPDTDAIDTGSNKFVTDWASQGQGAGTFINLSFASVESLASVFLTDRTTSGGPNGGFVGGLSDYTTQFSLQAYTDGAFTTPTGSPLIFLKAPPANPTTVADFQVTEPLSGLTGQFLRYTVLTSNGVNPGLADIQFGVIAVPEPVSLALLGVGLLGIGTVRRKRT